MNELRPYAKTVVLISTPAFLLAAAFHAPAVAVASLTMLVSVAAGFPSEARAGFSEGVKGLGVLALIAFTLCVAALGGFVCVAGMKSGVVWKMAVGAGVALSGLAMTRSAVAAFVLVRPAPATSIVGKPRINLAPRRVDARVTGPPPPRPNKPISIVEKPKPREKSRWGGRWFPAYAMDEGGYMISGPPGRGKTTLLRLFLKQIIEEVLDPRCNSTLIMIDPKREMYSWIASQWPENSPIPLELFCASDPWSVNLDWDYDFSSLTDRETFALALFPKNPHETQPFFGNASRTVVEAAITAIRNKLGTWNLRTLMLVLSNPGYLKKLIGGDLTTKFVEELFGDKSAETVQNIQMEITSKISKWRKVAAHLSQIDPKARPFSLERFLRRPGVLVVQKHDNYPEQHNAMNAMLLQRIGQMLKIQTEDPQKMRKIYIVIDEFPSLGCIEGFDDMCRELRSRGVVFVALWQSWANIMDVWKQKADTIQGTLQNYIILGSADMTDAKHASELIGKTRGYEAQRNETTGSGTTYSCAKSETETGGWSLTRTRRARGGFGPFVPTDATGTSGSHAEGETETIGESKQKSEGVTWIHIDRDIKSPTEVMRTPLPTKEGGFHGVAYAAGQPNAWDFVYESEFVDSIVHKPNRFIENSREWPEKFQIIEELTPWEIWNLGLSDTKPSAPELYPTQEEAAKKFGVGWLAGDRSDVPASGAEKNTEEEEDDGDWDAEEDASLLDDASWLDDDPNDE